MEITQVYQNLSQFEKIGESNNSKIYSLIGPNSQPMQKVLKTIIHPSESKTEHCKQCDHLRNESNILKQLSHKNIIKMSNPIMSNYTHNGLQLCAIELEKADYDLLQVLEQTFPNLVDFSFMKQMLFQIAEGLQYLHNQNISHNDLKLENILLVNNVPKISDFGFARQTDKQSHSVQLQRSNWVNRATMSLSPELTSLLDKNDIKSKHYVDEIKSDIFSLGVLFFSAIFLRSPVSNESADENDEFYQFIKNKNFEEFWKIEDFQGVLQILSTKFSQQEIENLKDLLQNMLLNNHNERFNIEQVLSHSFFKF